MQPAFQIAALLLQMVDTGPFHLGGLGRLGRLLIEAVPLRLPALHGLFGLTQGIRQQQFLLAGLFQVRLLLLQIAVQLLQPLFVLISVGFRLTPRITSYNVCYTKLLRCTPPGRPAARTPSMSSSSCEEQRP